MVTERDVQVGDQREQTTIDVKENEAIKWPMYNTALAFIQSSSGDTFPCHRMEKKGELLPLSQKVNACFGVLLSLWNRIKQKALFGLEMSWMTLN